MNLPALKAVLEKNPQSLIRYLHNAVTDNGASSNLSIIAQ
jgi:hypothetical protein